MPENGIALTPKSHLLNTAEILRLAELFVKQGVSKIRLTGGEPTVHTDLKRIIGKFAPVTNFKFSYELIITFHPRCRTFANVNRTENDRFDDKRARIDQATRRSAKSRPRFSKY